MNRAKALKFAYFAALLLGIGLVFAPGLTSQSTVFAQDVAETPTAEQPTPTVPAATPTVPAATPTVPGATPTVQGPTATPDASNPTPVNPTSTPTSQPPQPVPIPEPVTVVLFGTGLAALSAAVAARRKKE